MSETLVNDHATQSGNGLNHTQQVQDSFQPDFARQIRDLPDWLFDVLPAAVYVCDERGVIVRSNRLATELWGREPVLVDPAERFCDSFRMYRLDGTPIPHAACPMAEALQTGRPVFDQEVVIERTDGSRCAAMVNINPLKDTDGQIIGAVNCFHDLTERKQVEEQERRAREEVGDLTRQLALERDRLCESEQQCQALLDALPAALYRTDASGRLTYYNEGAVALWGYCPELGTTEFCGSWKLYWPDGTPMPHDECPMAISLKTGTPVRGAEAIAERPDGTRVPFIPYPTLLHDSSGAVVGGVNMLIDITERKQAELTTQRLASIVESSDDAIVSKDLNGTITSWNEGAERLFGYSAEEAVGKPITILIPPDRRDDEIEILPRIRAGEHIEHYETIRRRKDGTLVDISLRVSPLKGSQDRIIGASKIARDITEQKRAEQTRELLLNEIKHRVKNSLATVQSIAMQTFRRAPHEEREAFMARLQGLANAYDLLTRHNWGRAPVQDAVELALAPFQEVHHERFSIGGPKASLDAGKSLLLALVLHELGTNAVKYGALCNDTGQVDVAWEVHEDVEVPWVKLCWRETGGPVVKPPQHKGFGSLLIENALKRELGGAQFEFAPQGIVCTLNIAL